jgi:hypothetical protein
LKRDVNYVNKPPPSPPPPPPFFEPYVDPIEEEANAIQGVVAPGASLSFVSFLFTRGGNVMFLRTN